MPLSQRKPITFNWNAFAEGVVEKAGVLDDSTAEILRGAFAAVPRDKFMEAGFEVRAVEDEALPIGHGQTISRPSTVARMLALVGIKRSMRVLEIGCGCGYASAVMAATGAQVFAVEYLGLLAQRTRARMDALNFQNVIIRRGDGRKGWAEHAPYDAIIVSAAFEYIEPELLAQLKSPGGRLVAPVGNADNQVLYLWESKREGLTKYQLEPCRFVEGQSY